MNIDSVIVGAGEGAVSNPDPAKEWILPDSWENVEQVDLHRITIDGLEPLESGKRVRNGRLTLTLRTDEGVTIVPAGRPPQ